MKLTFKNFQLLIYFLFAVSLNFAQNSDYCETLSYHFGNPAETASVIYLTITNQDATSMYVEIESGDADPVDFLLITGGSGAVISDEIYPEPGIIRRTMTWTDPPADVIMNILWSKESFSGNWMLSAEDITVPFAASCSVGPAYTVNVDFEPDGLGAEWEWSVQENYDNPPLEIVENPDTTGANTSATAAKFTARVTGQPWALVYTDDIETFKFDVNNSIVKIMVNKPVISNITVKFEGGSSPAVELQIPNTVTNEWEELEFDFSGYIGNNYGRLVIIPDFDARTQENIIYFDNIQIPEGNYAPPAVPTVAAPAPTANAEDVISMFSNAYTNVPVDTWSASWDQADLEDIQIAGDDTKLYTNLVYAGIEFTSQPIDATEMTHFHMDFWTPDPTALPAVFKIKLVDFGADGLYGGGNDSEHELTFDAGTTPALLSGEWVSFDIPMASFSGLAESAHLAQMIISGDPNTVYLDNIYFYEGEVVVSYYNADFEPDGIGADWEWIVSENDDNPPLEFVANPSTGGINSSATVAKFTARLTGQQWALTFTDDLAPFEFNNMNSTFKIMIHKTVISNVGVKFEGGGSVPIEIQIPNTVTDEWEEMVFDFSAAIGNSYTKLVIIPDFNERTQENIIYFDNIQLPAGNVTPPVVPTVAAPSPTMPASSVISLFSNEYTDVLVDTWSAEWDQADVEDVQIAGNDTKLYTNLLYAGIEFVYQPVDATNMTHFRMDFWTPDPPAVFKVKLVDFGADGIYGGGDDTEHELVLDANTTPGLLSKEWVSLDMLMSDFTGLASVEHLAQLIISGDPNTVYLDNILFYGENTVTTVDFSVTEGWNLLSYPLLETDMSVSTLFPGATSSAYSFDNGYTPVDYLNNGEGYWVKFDAAEQFTAEGDEPTGDLSLSEGWNMIGVYNETVSVSNIITEPAGILSSSFYEFTSGYEVADNLVPGKGYWIKSSQAGNILMVVEPKHGRPVNMVNSEWGKITVTDAEGNSKVLYVSDESANGFELPPVPPAGAFDVRFSTGSYVESLSSGLLDIMLNSVAYPVKISVDGTDIMIKDKVNGQLVNNNLSSGDEIIITNSNVNVIEVSSLVIPEEYTLEQNYPNPFNPTTNIKFSVPTDSKIVLAVYNVLGEKVMELIDSKFEAGVHNVTFDASHLSSGMYLYRLEAGDFVEVKKMMLMK